MRKALFVLLAILPLSGCASLQPYLSQAPAVAQQVITDAQNAAVAICQFLPTAETVAGILATGNPAVQTASSIANAICGAVASKGAASAMAADIPIPPRKAVAKKKVVVPTVLGVPIRGQFIR